MTPTNMPIERRPRTHASAATSTVLCNGTRANEAPMRRARAHAAKLFPVPGTRDDNTVTPWENDASIARPINWSSAADGGKIVIRNGASCLRAFV